MTDPVQQAREALERWESIPGDPTDEEVDLAVSIRVLIAHVEALVEKRARLIDPADLGMTAEKMEALAGFLDLVDTLAAVGADAKGLGYVASTEAQDDVRRWAGAIRAAREANP